MTSPTDLIILGLILSGPGDLLIFKALIILKTSYGVVGLQNMLDFVGGGRYSVNNWPVCGGRLSAKCLPTVQKYSFEKLQISFRSVTIQLLLHSFAICGLILRYGVRGVACQKQRLGPKLEGAGLGEHPKNLGLPTYFCNR